LLDMIFQYALDKSNLQYPFYITREWQFRRIHDAARLLENAKTICARGCSPDIVAFEIRSALENLSDLVGEYHSDEILNEIFNSFCVGK
ncbi:MAG TPA: hypothetical protein ENN84_11665, partial [Candidatus Marinimicrobia bacterium]|nr:hypothetical protein [Candidatus Neomarinimicrobiota bacterium]